MHVETVIRPVAGTEHIHPAKLWEFRHLLGSLVTREIRVKFDNVKFGALWACARPAAMVAILVTVRGGSDAAWPETMPFPLYVYSGIILWFYFCDCLVESAHAVQRDAGIISKLFFPRLISPIVPMVSNSVEFGISAVPLIGFMYHFGVFPGWRIILLPVVLIVALMIALGIGLVFSSLMLHRRDWERVLGLMLYLGLFASPIFHSFSAISDWGRILELLNPMVGVLSAFRSCLSGVEPFPVTAFTVSAAFAFGLLGIGIWQFRRLQDRLLEML